MEVNAEFLLSCPHHALFSPPLSFSVEGKLLHEQKMTCIFVTWPMLMPVARPFYHLVLGQAQKQRNSLFLKEFADCKNLN